MEQKDVIGFQIEKLCYEKGINVIPYKSINKKVVYFKHQMVMNMEEMI